MAKENVRLVRLVSGEELVGQIEETETGVTIKKAAIVIVQPPRTSGEQLGIALIGWLPYTQARQDGITVKKEHVLFIVTPEPNMIKTYNEKFTSESIVVPQPDVKRPSGLLIPSQFTTSTSK